MASVGDNIRAGGAKGLPRSLVQLIANIDAEIAAAAASGVTNPRALIRDEKADGVQGGTFTAGAWQTRDLNTVVFDEIGIGLSSNQLTLQNGIYLIKARCPAFFCNSHKARLQNISDVATEDEGTSAKSNDDSTNSESTQESMIIAEFEVISGPKIYEVQHQCETTTLTNGFGTATTFVTLNEIYTVVELEKTA